MDRRAFLKVSTVSLAFAGFCLYFSFGSKFNPGEPTKFARVDFLVEFWDRRININRLPPTNASIPRDVELFLRPTKHVQTDGIVREYALRITEGARTDLEKARAIHDWIVEITFRDPILLDL